MATMIIIMTHTPVQNLEVVYLLYRAYYWLPVMLLSLTAAAAVSLILTLRRQRLKVMALVNHCRLTPIVQAGWVRAVSSHTLVPGDVVVLRRGKAMCDMVLLQGACLVVESMLSGEVSYLLLLFFLALLPLPPLLPHSSPRPLFPTPVLVLFFLTLLLPLLPHPSPSSPFSFFLLFFLTLILPPLLPYPSASSSFSPFSFLPSSSWPFFLLLSFLTLLLPPPLPPHPCPSSPVASCLLSFCLLPKPSLLLLLSFSLFLKPSLLLFISLFSLLKPSVNLERALAMTKSQTLTWRHMSWQSRVHCLDVKFKTSQRNCYLNHTNSV